jgi:hypothetical protein
MKNSPKLWTKVPKNTASSKRRLNSQDRVRSEIWKVVKRIIYKGQKGKTLKARRAFSYWPEAEGREKIEGLETKTKYLKSPPHDTDLPILKKKIRYWWMHESCWVEVNFKDTAAFCIIETMLNVHKISATFRLQFAREISGIVACVVQLSGSKPNGSLTP